MLAANQRLTCSNQRKMCKAYNGTFKGRPTADTKRENLDVYESSVNGGSAHKLSLGTECAVRRIATC